MSRAGRRAGGRAVVLLAVLLPASPPTRLPAQGGGAEERGKAVYDKWCAQCHGDTGAGDGPAAAYMLPRPRDFTTAQYQVRTTGTGELPTDADILRAIDEGLPGTAMPGWKDRLSADDRRALVPYLKAFSTFFEGATPRALDPASAPGGGEESLRLGREMYDSNGCAKCHGDAGRGDGPSTAELDDDAGNPIVAANLTKNWLFNGGGSVEDVYRTLLTGLDGTPMPSVDTNVVPKAELWHLARYVRGLSPDEPPRLRDVILARRIEGQVPERPEDSAWAAADEYGFPLVGQIIRKSRWFGPAVTDVRVRAVHNGERLALRVSWDDRSRSPADTTWLAYTRKVLAALAGDDSVPPEAGPWPDQLAVQFPRRLVEGTERPYFLMGSSADPVYQWRWRSEPAGGEEGTARGIDRYDPQPAASQALGARAVYDRGEWQVVFARALATSDTANDLQFRPGRAIPIAFFAWDGSSGEHGTRLAVSSWYFLALAEPTPPRVFLAPVVAMALTLGLGLWVVRRANSGSGDGGRGKGA